jgi:GTP-binding protein Era
MNAASMEAAAEADVVVLVLDAAAALNAAGLNKADGQGHSAQGGVPASALEADAAVIAHVPPRTPVLCALNKIDRVAHKALLLPLLERIAATASFAAIVPASAKHADGMDRLLSEVEKLLPEGAHAFGADELSDRPVRFFVAEFVREQVLHQTREEVPHGVAVTVERFDEAPNVPRICVTVHVDKESHKPIVIGKGGATLKAIGVEARARTEVLLGKQVYLEIRVRVTPHWYENEALLRDFGYAPPPKAGSPSRSGGGEMQ